ncbi:helix-turn-helix domain-containing protein [Nostoc sp. CHAB 5834]|nr:helix-turn-helix domain-containing protein [Nostoc sp. CHAB 5834]
MGLEDPSLSRYPLTCWLLRAHKIHLYPNHAQANHFARACGTARFA